MKQQLLKDFESLKKREADLGREFQRRSRSLVEEFTHGCMNEFLRFFAPKGFIVTRAGTAFGDNEVRVEDDMRSITLEVIDDSWSGPPPLRIRTRTATAVRVDDVSVRRQFPPAWPRSPAQAVPPIGDEAQRDCYLRKEHSIERLRELIMALPDARYSLRLSRTDAGEREDFRSFSALLHRLFP